MLADTERRLGAAIRFHYRLAARSFLPVRIFLRLNGPDALAHLLGVVLYHGRALAGHCGDKIIAATSLQKFTGGVVAPTVDIEVQAPIRSLTFLTAAEAPL